MKSMKNKILLSIFSIGLLIQNPVSALAWCPSWNSAKCLIKNAGIPVIAGASAGVYSLVSTTWSQIYQVPFTTKAACFFEKSYSNYGYCDSYMANLARLNLQYVAGVAIATATSTALLKMAWNKYTK